MLLMQSYSLFGNNERILARKPDNDHLGAVRQGGILIGHGIALNERALEHHVYLAAAAALGGDVTMPISAPTMRK